MAKSKSPKPTASSDLKDELDKLCKDFEAGGPDLDSIETEEAAKEFVIDYSALLWGMKDLKSDERDTIWQWAVRRMGSWDPDDASVTYSAKLLRLLGEARDGKTMLLRGTKLLGPTQVQTTQRYAHLAPQTLLQTRNDSTKALQFIFR